MGEKVPKSLHEKKTNHYVWVHYLKKWAVDELPKNKRIVNIWCRTQNNRSEVLNARAILSETYFYRIRSLKANHLELIRYYFQNSDIGLKKSILYFINFSRYLDYVESLNLKEKLSDSSDKAISLAKSNSLEDIHTDREKRVIQILDALDNQDLTILEDQENILYFIDFFSHQMMRTKAMKNRVLAVFNEKDKKIERLLEECWWLFSNSVGNNIGESLYCERKKNNHCLLINDSDEPFITSDTPVINVSLALDIENPQPLLNDECDLYYPISPRIAYMISCSHRFPKGKLKVSSELVNELNKKMAENSDIHIISNKKEMIDKYKTYVNIKFSKNKEKAQ